MNKKKIILGIVAVAVIAVAGVFFIGGGKKKPQLAFSTATVEKSDISNSVTATGTIEPVTEVEVGTQVSGIVDKLYADYNSEVHKGQLIAEMDKVTLQSELASTQAQYDGNKAEYDYQKKNYDRSVALHEKALISDTEYEQAVYNYKKAKSSLESSKAALAKAQRNLSYATITSPIDGIVIDRSVEEGQTVAAGFETPTLFTIAADLTKMQVVADVDEADIADVREGQRVSFTVDAYPNDTFEGRVTQVRLGSTSSSSSSSSSESVVTYEVVISAENPDLKLKPRLTANITIYTLDKQGVLSVPNKALRFTPEQEFLPSDGKIIDCEGENKVWTKEGNVFTAHAVTIGITNGLSTEITGGISEGTVVVSEIVVGDDASEVKEEQTTETSPFAPTPPGSKKKSSK